ncbi:MAG: hypothetical protein K2N23_06740 [Clostridia bacterium]|nr:hypothetical protein [Clostridia bacterium]
MVTLDEEKIKYVKRGETYGLLCLTVAVVGLIFFAVCYPIARVFDLRALLICSYAVSPLLIALGAAGSAACNLKYGKLADKTISQYIIDICLENPQAMHPERDSLTFYVSLDGCNFEMHANGYKEKLVFDFSSFKKLSPMRRASIATEIGNRITVTFCRLYERGAKYKDVNYTIAGSKKSKLVPIITNGIPDKKSFKVYLKNK